MRPILAIFLIICMASGCASHPKKAEQSVAPSTPASELSKSTAEEVAIGEQIHAKILQEFYPYTEPKVVFYLNNIGQKLASHAERKLPYRFTLLYDEKIYATSAPGGFIYFTTGLLYFLQNEAELAAVMAHEIGELQFQDPKLSRSRKILESVTKGSQMVAPAFGEIGGLALLAIIGANMIADRNLLSPEQKVSKADILALHYLVESGYDPQGMVDFLHKFLSANNEILPYFSEYFKSRPITFERFQAIEQEFKNLPLEGKSLSVNRKEYQEMMTGVSEIYHR